MVLNNTRTVSLGKGLKRMYARSSWVFWKSKGNQLSATSRPKDIQESDLQCESYAKVSCRQLCEQMVARLPRELRDMVYGYVHCGQPIEVMTAARAHRPGDKPMKRNAPVFFEARETPTLRTEALRKEAHYFQTEYVGYQFQHEIIEEWYQYSYFLLGNAKMIKLFCLNDVWEAGVIPSQWVRYVTLMFGHDTSSVGSCYDSVIHVKDSVRALKPLLQCRSGLLITINVSNPRGLRRQGCKRWRGPPDGFEPIPWRIALIKKIFPTLHQLIEQGQEVRMVFERETALSTAIEEFSEKAWIEEVKKTGDRNYVGFLAFRSPRD